MILHDTVWHSTAREDHDKDFSMLRSCFCALDLFVFNAICYGII